MPLQFVQEDPIDPDRSRKKRARIVTSCDHCRRKRVKCSTRTDQVSCDACLDSAIPCLWGDREHYYSQRAARNQAKAARQAFGGKATRKKKEWSSLHIVADNSGLTTNTASALSLQPISQHFASPSGSADSASASPNHDDTDAEGEMDEPYAAFNEHRPPSPQHKAESPTQSIQSTSASSHSGSGSMVLSSGTASLAIPFEPHVARKRKLDNVIPIGNTIPPKHYARPASLPNFDDTAPSMPNQVQLSHTPSPYGPPVMPPSSVSVLSMPQAQSSSSIHSILASTAAVPGQQYPLFNPGRPAYPHPVLMQHFIDLLDSLGSQWKGLDKDDITRRSYNQTLPDVLANGLAALAARYSDRPELFAEGQTRYSAGEAYCHMAKDLVTSQVGMEPSLDSLYALLFISWSEYGSGRRDSFFKYGEMAVEMLQKLDGPDAPYKVLPWNEEQELRLNLTWFATARLESCSSWLTGRPMVLQQARSTWVRKVTAAVGPVNTVLEMNRQMFLIREEFQKFLRMPDEQGEMLISQLSTIQNRLHHLTTNMPPQVAFSEHNLQLFLNHRRASTFLLVHLVMHMLTIMANCPSIFREPNGILKDRLDIACHSAREIGKIMLIAQQVDMDSVIAIPCFDMHIGVAAAALLMDSNLNTRHRGRRQATEVGLRDCQQLLTAISGYWRPLDVILHRLERRSPWVFMAEPDEFFLRQAPHANHKMLQSGDFSTFNSFRRSRPTSRDSDDEDNKISLPPLSSLSESFAFEKSLIINATQAFSGSIFQPQRPSASIAPWPDSSSSDPSSGLKTIDLPPPVSAPHMQSLPPLQNYNPHLSVPFRGYSSGPRPPAFDGSFPVHS